jgi:CSLREA domain-containing protein
MYMFQMGWAGCSRLSLAALAVVLAALLGPAPASAADLAVDSTADAVDANPGNGSCATTAGACTLRAAIQEANMQPGSDTITVPGGVYTLRLAESSVDPPQLPGTPFFDPALFGDFEGDHDIAGPLTITGAGDGETVIDGGAVPFGAAPEQTALDRIFEIHATAGNVTISDLTVREGWSEDSGGAIKSDSPGKVRLVDMSVRDSVATNYGGGVYSGGPLDGICPATCPVGDGRIELVRTTLHGNHTGGKGGGVFSTQSSVAVLGSAADKARFTDNTADEGAALYNGGELTPTGGRARAEVAHATFTDNVALADGGAIYNEHEGDLAVTDSSFERNLAWGEGGAIDSGSKTSASITRSSFAGNRSGGNGGAVNSHPERPVSITGSTFTDNHAGVDLIDELGQFHEGEGGGGAMFADGTGGFTLRGSRFEGNSAGTEGGALSLNTGGTALVADSEFLDNEADVSGGAILNAGMRVTFSRLTVSGNKAFEEGGGIDNQGSGDFVVEDTTISRNTAFDGGGISNRPDSLSRIVNSTLWDNRARNAGGGFDHESDADTEIENTTISGNIALVSGGGIFVDADGGLRVISSTVTGNTSPAGSGVGKPIESINFPVVPSLAAIFRNSIVAGNRLSTDCNGAWASEGGNFDGGTDCYFQGPRDRTNVDPRLDAIADNGGHTMTHAPRPDSHAVDGGLNTVTTLIDGSTAPCPSNDQRGAVRPRNARCDVGAHEFDGPFPAPDSVPPHTIIADDNPAHTGEIAKFRFSGTDDATAPEDLTFECRILNQEPGEPPEPVDPTEPIDPLDPELMWHGCSSPWPGDALQLEDGQSTLEVRAVDRAGNVDPTPDTHQFIGGEDITPPQTILTGTPLSSTTRNSAVFGFTATDDSTDITLIEYECRIDFGDWEAVECLNPMSFSNLTIGEHTFQVRAVDEGDNIDPSPATYTWTVESPTNCDEANITLGASADAYVDEVNPIENFGIAEQLTVASGEFGENARALVRFVLPTALPADCALTSARLRLYSDGEAGRTLQAIPVAQAWSEMNVTWMNQPPTTGAPATTGSGSGYREWNVTSQVDAMLAGTLPRHGWLIRDAVADDVEGADQAISSKDTIAEPPEVPKLVLRFAGGSSVPPPPPPSEDLEPDHVECGEVLTESTLVTNDLSCELGDAITVGAPDIVVDLGGHTIDGPDFLLLGQEDGLPTGIRNIGYENVVIRNGTVREYGNGVALMAGARFNVVEDMTLLRNALAGVELWDADDGRNGNVVRDSLFSTNEAGVTILGGTENNVVEDNVFDGNIGVAVHVVDSSGNRIERNEVSGVPLDPNLDSDGGIRLEGATDNAILANRLNESGDAGVVLSMGSHRNRVEGNVMTATGDAGIAVEDSDENEVIDNAAHLGSDAGVVLSAANDGVVLDNDVRFNPTGVDLGGSSGNLIEGNDADGSDGTGIAVSGGQGNRVAGNSASNTGSDGIVVEGMLGGNVVEGNTTNHNLSDGIVADAGQTLTGNAAHDNAGWGIQGAEATVDGAGAIDGGGNTASGNGEVEQCQGVACTTGTEPPPSDGPDLEAPETIVTEGPADGTASTAMAILRFTGTDDAAPATALRHECRLDPPPDPVIPPEPPEPPEPGEPPEPIEPVTEHWEECSSPIRVQYLLTGEHRFEVRATDPSDNVDLTPAVHTWTVSAAPPGPDSTAPNTTLVDGPSDPTTSRSATFRFRGSDNTTPGPDLRYECRLDGGAWALCSSPATYSGLTLGDHTFAVRALDIQGNPDPTPASHAWTIDAEPPDVTPPNTRIDSAPDLLTVQTGASFEFSSTEEGSTFECSLDGATFAACATPRGYSSLAVGEHTFRVRAVDAAGNADDTPASHTWTVGPAPVSRNVSCGLVLTQSVRITNDLVDCEGDGLVIGAAGITVDLNGRMIDGKGQSAGIRNDGFDWVTITGEGKLQEFDYGVQLNSGTAHNIVSDITTQLNQEAGVQLSNADEGAAGNVVRRNLVTLNSLAGISVIGGTQNALLRENTIGGNPGAGVHIFGSSGTRVEQNTVSASSEAGVLLEGATQNTIVDNLLTGNSGEPLAVTLGSHDNRVESNDISTNSKGVVLLQSNGTELIENVVHEISDTAISLEAANDSQLLRNDVRGNSGGVDVYQSSRNRLEENLVSENSGSGIWIGDLSYQNIVRRNVANANDSSGIMVEVEAPGGSGTLVEGNTANANDSSGISLNKVGHTLVDNTANNNMAWGIYSSTATSIGTNVDAGGNRAVGNKELLQCFEVRCDGTPPVRETFPPGTLIDEGPDDTTPTDSVTFRFSGSDNALMEVEFECRLDGGAFQPCVSPRGYSGLDEGDHVFEVRSVDQAGNIDPTPARWEWTYEPLPPGVPPETMIDSGPDPVTVSTTATLGLGSNEPDVSFECSLDGAAFAPCASPKEYTGLAVGDHSFRARATDGEGNVDASPATHAWKIGPPPVATAVSCGQVLTQSVRVKNSLTDCPAGGLVIGADDITVDLDGHTIDGVGEGAGIRNPRFDGVTVTNGSVQEFSVGVAVDPSARNVVSTLNATLNALAGIQLSGARDAAVRTNTLGANEGEAIALLGGTQATVVRDNTITGNLGRGIWIESSSGNRIEDNSITASEDAAIALDGAANTTLRRNSLSANVGGIEVLAFSHGTRLERNTVTSGGGGILVAQSNAAQVLENQVQQTTDAGITLDMSNGGVVRRNDLRFNNGGIMLSDSSGNRVESNNASGTTGTGIGIDGASLSNVVAMNTAGSNGGEGIAVDAVAPAGQGNLIDRNSALSNGDDGLIVTGSGHTIVANVAHINGEWGMYVEPGNVDGGGNLAAGNVEPQQCFGIACSDGGFVPPGLPDTQLLDRPANPSHSRSASFTFVGTDDTTALIDLEFQCRLDSTNELDWQDCENPQQYSGLTPGRHTFEVRAMDAAEAVDPTPATYTWTYQPLPAGVAPNTFIDLAPPAQTPLLDAVFQFSSDEPDVTFQCKLDAGPWQDCGSDPEMVAAGFYALEHGFEDHEVGPHRFQVRATDLEGNVDLTPAVHEWTITGVLTTIFAGPAFEAGEGGDPPSGGETGSTTATFDFGASVADATYECSLDLGSFTPCEPPVTYTGLAVGDHLFRVVATDPEGEFVEAEPVEYEWTVIPPVDIGSPQTAITGSPADGSSDTTFAFTGTDDQTATSQLTFECRLDSLSELDWYECLSPHNLLEEIPAEELAPGSHRFDVRAIDDSDPEGNPDPTPASHTWTSVADTIPPDTTLLVTPPTPTIEIDTQFEFTGTDNATPATLEAMLLEFECSLDGAAFEPCDSPHDAQGLAPGEHTLRVRSVDLALNADPTPASFTWRVIGPPETTIDSPPPAAGDTTVTFAFSSDQPGSTFECSFDGSAMEPCLSPLVIDVGGGGEHVFEVRATNEHGMLDETPAVQEWIVDAPPDTSPPDTTILTGPDAVTLSPDATFTFSSSQFGSTFECRLDGQGFGDCSTPHALTGVASGDHVLEVRAVDPSGNADPTPAVHPWTYDGPPVVDLLDGPPEEAESTTATFTFVSSDAGSTFECWLDGVIEPCTSSKQYTDLPLGEHVFAVRATDPVGQVSVQWEEWEWTVLAPTPPQTNLTGGPPSGTTQTGATFSFASSDAGSTFECSLDGSAFAACESPADYGGLAAGDHAFHVRATDPFGNTDATPADHTWTVLGAAQLETSIGFGPPAATIETEATFSFSANAADATFECSLDDAAFEACASPVGYSALAAGEHTFAVRAVDAAGDAEATPASRSWLVVGPPVTTFQSAPAAQTTDPDPAFAFSADQTDATYLCSLDGAEPEPCTSPVAFTDVGGGTHTFEVEATNSFGLVEDPPALHEWTVDGPPESTPPETAITVAPPAHSSSPDALFEFTGTDNRTGALELDFECALDGGAFAGCSTPHELQDLAPGEHTLAVRAVDEAGNADPTPATHGWRVEDVIAPETTIGAGPDSPTQSTSATFEFSADEPASTFECSLDGAAFASCTSPHQVDGVALGDHRLDVRARDAAGNADPTPDVHEWIVEPAPDTVAPDTIILSAPPAETSDTTAAFGFTSDEAVEGFECSLDGGPFTGCGSPHELSGMDLGEHTLEVRAIDLAGNVDATPDSHLWTVVAPPPPPETAIESAPASPQESSNATFAFSSDEPDVTFECRLDGGEWASCGSPHVVTGLTEGPHTFEVRAKRSFGVVDETPAAHHWTVGLPPETSIVMQPPAATASTTARFEFTGTDDRTPLPDLDFECSLDGAEYQSCSSPRELQDLAAGDHVFRVRAKDWTNTVDPTPAELAWTIGVPPDSWIDSGPESATASTEATFTFASQQGDATFECALDQEPEHAAYTVCSSPATYAGLAMGPHALLVRAVSADGIVDPSPAEFEWKVGDMTAPVTTIGSGPALESPSATASFAFTADEAGVSFRCSLDGAALTFCTSPKEYTDLAPGDHVFEVHAFTPHLLVDPEPAIWQWTVLDVTDPETTILTGPPATTTSTEAELTFSSNEPGATFECSLDGAPFAQCSSPEGRSGLAVGPHELRIRAVDAAGNADETPAVRTWTVLDGTPPDTEITAEPADPSANGSPSFGFEGTDETSPQGALLYQCRLDSLLASAWVSCTSPHALSGLGDGAHTFQVRAVDEAGNADPAPATFAWTVDVAPPQTTVASGPSATTTSTSASFTFSASEAGSTFECSLDAAAFGACSSPHQLTGLAPGAHQFRVRAIDALGNADDTPATHSWTISAGCTASTVTVGAAIDSWILQSSSGQNYGTDSVLKVDTKSGANARGLVRFNLPAAPAGCQVTSAKLRLYATSYKTGRTLQALLLGATWTEGGVKWSNQPATTGAAVTTASGSGYREWAVTAHVQAMYAGVNHGWLIRDATENGGGLEQAFHSREKGTDNPPRLVVGFG